MRVKMLLVTVKPFWKMTIWVMMAIIILLCGPISLSEAAPTSTSHLMKKPGWSNDKPTTTITTTRDNLSQLPLPHSRDVILALPNLRGGGGEQHPQQRRRRIFARIKKTTTTTAPPVDTAKTPAIRLPPAIRILYTSTFFFVLSGSLVSLAPPQALIQYLSASSSSSSATATTIISDDTAAERATTLLSLIATSAALLEVLASAAVGSVLDRVGRKPALLVILVIVCGTHLFTALVPGMLSVCWARFVNLWSIGFFVLVTQTMISDLVSQVTVVRNKNNTKNSRSSSNLVSSTVGVQMALTGVGFLLGIIGAGVCTEQGLPVVYGVSAAFGMVSLVLVQLALPETLPTTTTTTTRSSSTTRSKLTTTTTPRTTPKNLFESLTSCTRLLTRHGPRVRVLGILLMLLNFPAYMGDTFQIFTKSEWNLSPQQLSVFLATFGMLGIFSNAAGSALVQRMGIRNFTTLAVASRIVSQLGTILFGYQGSLVAMVIGFLGSAQTIGVLAALVDQGNQSGLPQGELAGERASLTALLKVIGPILYSTLYVQGEKVLGTRKLPFFFNILLFVVALVISATRL